MEEVGHLQLCNRWNEDQWSLASKQGGKEDGREGEKRQGRDRGKGEGNTHREACAGPETMFLIVKVLHWLNKEAQSRCRRCVQSLGLC